MILRELKENETEILKDFNFELNVLRGMTHEFETAIDR